MTDSIDNLPFEELIRYLNGGYYLDTFEVGSVKIDPTPWPTTPRKPIKITCARNQTQSVSKKEAEDKLSCKVKKVVIKVSVSTCPKVLENEEEEKKLEGTKRKLRQQYELIENEKKKRRVQIIDFKPQPPSMQPPTKKQQRKKPLQILKPERKIPSLHLANAVF